MDYRKVKRLGDAAVAGAGLILTLPLQAAVAIGVRTTMGSPVLFRQDRPGLNGDIFTLVKFRTMRPPGNSENSDAARLTRFGKFLRATSLDELPTLWNVLRGDMSLVGPRPLLISYLPLYSPTQARRHEVRPGVTGLAQVSGRNALGWDERFRLDVEYVDNLSLLMDLKILFRTAKVVLTADGVAAEGQATVVSWDVEVMEARAKAARLSGDD